MSFQASNLTNMSFFGTVQPQHVAANTHAKQNANQSVAKMPWHMQHHSCILVTSELGCDLLPVDVKATMDLNPKISQAAQIATECTHQIISHIPSITGATVQLLGQATRPKLDRIILTRTYQDQAKAQALCGKHCVTKVTPKQHQIQTIKPPCRSM